MVTVADGSQQETITGDTVSEVKEIQSQPSKSDVQQQNIPTRLKEELHNVYERLKKIDMDNHNVLLSLTREIDKNSKLNLQLSDLKSKRKGIPNIEGTLFKKIKAMWDVKDEQGFLKMVLHDPTNDFDSTNIMTLFVLGLFSVNSMLFSEWVENNTTNVRNYILDFLLYIEKGSTIKFVESTETQYDLPDDDTKIPDTLCITDEVIKPPTRNFCFLGDLDNVIVPWSSKIGKYDMITSTPALWYVYVQWIFREEKLGCYGVLHDKNCYFFTHDLPDVIDEIVVSDEVPKQINPTIEEIYDKYIDCLEILADTIEGSETLPTDFISNPNSSTFKFNRLLYVHLLILGHSEDKKVLFVNMDDNIVKDALWAGQQYGEFKKELMKGNNHVIEKCTDISAIENLALAHLELMQSRPYNFDSDGDFDYKACKDKFMTTCPVHYHWVFEDPRLGTCKKWIEQFDASITSIHIDSIGVMRRILNVIREYLDGYTENTIAVGLQMFKTQKIFSKVKDERHPDKDWYIVFDFEMYAKNKNLFNKNSKIKDFCGGIDAYKHAVTTVVKNDRHWHYCDFNYKYILTDISGTIFHIADAGQLEYRSDTSNTEINTLSNHCPFCLESVLKLRKMITHIHEKHADQEQDIALKTAGETQHKKLEATGGETYKVGSDTFPSNLVIGGPNTPASRASQKSYNWSSAGEAKYEEEWLSRQPAGESTPRTPVDANNLTTWLTQVSAIEKNKAKPLLAPITPTPSESVTVSNGQSKKKKRKKKTNDKNANKSNETQDNPPILSPTPANEDETEKIDTEASTTKPPTPPPASASDPEKPRTPLPVIPTVSRVSTPQPRPETPQTKFPDIGRPNSAPSNTVGNVVKDLLKPSNRNHQGNDKQIGKELLEINSNHRKALKRWQDLSEGFSQQVVDLNKRLEEKEKKNKEDEQKIQELNDQIESLNNDTKRISEELVQANDKGVKHAGNEEKIEELKNQLTQKEDEIQKLRNDIEEKKNVDVKTLESEQSDLQTRNDELEGQIQRHIDLLEELKKEIKDNEKKKDENSKFIDTQIDELYTMDIDALGLQDLLNEGKFEEFKKEVEDDNPEQEEHSACALFLIYESMAGTWKMFINQQQQKEVGSLITQKLMHEYRLYQSIKNHDLNVQARTSKYFRQFKKDFVEKQAAVEEIP